MEGGGGHRDTDVCSSVDNPRWEPVDLWLTRITAVTTSRGTRTHMRTSVISTLLIFSRAQEYLNTPQWKRFQRSRAIAPESALNSTTCEVHSIKKRQSRSSLEKIV